MNLLRSPVIPALAIALGAVTVAPPSAQAANPFGIAYRRCIEFFQGPSALEKKRIEAAATNSLRDGTRFPSEFTPEERQALLQEFMDDGRPILVVTDAHYGQKSGVVTVMKVLKEKVEKLTQGRVKLEYIMPTDFNPQLKLPYQDLVVSWMGSKKFAEILKTRDPQAIHVMVEGTLGGQARSHLINEKIPFTTAYHTMFPEYVRDLVAKYSKALAEPARKLTNKHLKDFHAASEGILVPTESMAKNLIENGYDAARIRYWSHGVDTELFHPGMADPKVFEGLPRPISTFIGRVAVEKNIEDFLKMDIPGTKVVVGGGPEEAALKKKYPNAVFLGRKNYEDLPTYYASSDVFVFPSTTDTFGLVQLEANATGTPVVAYKVQGPVDVITSPDAGRLAEYSDKAGDANVRNLEKAWHEASGLHREKVRAFAEDHTWDQSALEFLYFLRRLEKNPR